MDIVFSVLIGAAAGGLAIPFRKYGRTSEWSTLAVGILGALLGVVSSVRIGAGSSLGGLAASCVGALLALLLWPMAQKLLRAAELPGEQD